MKIVYLSHPYTGNESINKGDAREMCDDRPDAGAECGQFGRLAGKSMNGVPCTAQQILQRSKLALSQAAGCAGI